MSLRWVWSLLAVCMVAVVAAVMAYGVADIERRSWQASQEEQATLLLTLLSDELKLPMLANSLDEVETLMQKFAHRLPGSMIYLRRMNGEDEKIGDGKLPRQITALQQLPARAASVQGLDKWYAMSIRYNATELGALALYAPGAAWDEYAQDMQLRLAAIAFFLTLMAGAVAYWRSGPVCRSLRMLSRASRRVGGGDFSIHLPIRSENEFGLAFQQFNQMVASLEHREKVHDLFGNYAQPQKVADAFDRHAGMANRHVREVTVLAINMVDFDGFQDRLAPDDAFAALNRYFALFHYVVNAFGGHVDRVAGAAMLAVFNHPFDLKCHENQAAKAGLAIINICHRLALPRPDGGEIKFSAGMSRGAVQTGCLGVGRRREFTIIGQPVALAEQLAAQGRGDELTAPYGIMPELGHGFKSTEIGMRTLAAGREMRCIAILPGEAYVEQEVDEKVGQAFDRVEPLDYDDEDDW